MSNDPDGNLRYVGANPNNYVKFYNQLWRIIGIFDGYTKIVSTNQEIIPYNDHNSNYQDGSSLSKKYNETYYTNVDETTRSYIASPGWRYPTINSYVTDLKFSSRKPVYEGDHRIIGVGSVNPICLITFSDFLYSTSKSDAKCEATVGYGKIDADCVADSWLYISKNKWPECTMTSVFAPSGSSGDHLVCVYPENSSFSAISVENNGAFFRPALYLKPEVKIMGESGTSSDPYTLIMN